MSHRHKIPGDAAVRLPSCRLAWLFSLLSLPLLSTGCGSLDTLDGYTLGVPESVIYGHDPAGNQTMIVFSNLPSLCSRLKNNDPPSQDEYWVISVSAPESFVSLTRDGTTEEFAVVDQSLTWEYDCPSALDRFLSGVPEEAACPVDGDVSLVMETGDVLDASFEAEYCDAPLFNGL